MRYILGSPDSHPLWRVKNMLSSDVTSVCRNLSIIFIIYLINIIYIIYSINIIYIIYIINIIYIIYLIYII